MAINRALEILFVIIFVGAFAQLGHSQTIVDCGTTSPKVPTGTVSKLGNPKPGIIPTPAVIRGGAFADISQMPGLVHIKTYNYISKLPDGEIIGSYGSCGATRISSKFLVTAAHCLNNLRVIEEERPYVALEITYGSSDLADNDRGRAFVNTAFCHSSYDTVAGNLYNDIAVIDISHPDLADLRANLPIAQIMPVPTNGVDKFTVAGWGQTSSGLASSKLKKGEMNYQWHGPGLIRVTPHSNGSTTSSICQGDSGGPLYMSTNRKKFLVGVVSSELPMVDTKGCENYNDAVFTNISSYEAWISGLP